MGAEGQAIQRALDRYQHVVELIGRARNELNILTARSAANARTAAQQAADEARRAEAASDVRLRQEVERARTTAADRLQKEVVVPINAAIGFLGHLAADWSSPSWSPGGDAGRYKGLPGAIRVGSIEVSGGSGAAVPAMLPLLASRPILMVADESGAGTAAASVRNALARIVATVPPGRYRLTLIDAVGLGQNLKEFLRLPPSVRGDKVFADGREIEAELTRLMAHVESVTQTQLLDSRTIEEHNRRDGVQLVRYEFVAIVGFPFGFSETAAATFLRLVDNGPRTGTVVIASSNAGADWPRAVNAAALADKCSTIRIGTGRTAKWNHPQLSRFSISLDPPPDERLLVRLLEESGRVAQAVEEEVVGFERFAIPLERRWKANSTDGLRVPIGVDAAGKTHDFVIGSELIQHGLIGGLPRSGKTNLLHVLLVQLASAYSPEELEVYLLDFKQGVEFQDYATAKLPHARAIALESEPELGVSVLNALEREKDRRSDLFRAAQASTVQAYRATTGRAMPRILVVLDEYQVLFGDGGDPTLTSNATALLADLVKQGPAYGIHVLLSSQTPASSFTSNRAAMNLINLRITLKIDDANARLILGDNNDGARKLEKPGEAVYNAAGGDLRHNVMLKVAMLEPDDRRELLAAISGLASRQSSRPAWSPYIFSSRSEVRLSDNDDFGRLLNGAGGVGADGARMWLGEPIELAPHVAALLSRTPRSNLMVAGQEERVAHQVLESAIIGACTDIDPNHALLTAVTVSKAGQPWSTMLGDLADCLPHPVDLISPDQLREHLVELAACVAERRAGANAETTRILIVPGLDRLDALREVDKFGKSAGAATAFLEIVTDGPAVGVHVLGWASTFTGVERVLHRPGTEAFGLRVALPMTAAESNAFLQLPAANRLGANRALFQDDVRGDHMVKFKPYELLGPEEWTQLSRRIRQRNDGTTTGTMPADHRKGPAQ